MPRIPRYRHAVTPSRSSRAHRNGSRFTSWRCRRPYIEPLEDRTLLAGLIDATITAAQQQALDDGLQALSTWGSSLGNFGALAQAIPGLGTTGASAGQSITVGQTLDLSDTLARGLQDPVDAFFQEHDGTTLPTTDDLVTALTRLSGQFGALDVTVNPPQVSGGETSTGTELQFNLDYQATRTTTVGLNPGANATQYNLAVNADATVNLAASLNLDFTFGYNLTPGLSEANAFFIRVNTLQVGASVQAQNLNFSAQVGFLGVAVQNGQMNLNGNVAVTFPGAGAGGTITLGSLQNTALSTLVALTPTLSMNATLPIQASLGSFTTSGNPTITLTANALDGTAPTIGFSGFGNLLDFNNLTANNVYGLLNQVDQWLEGLDGSSLLQTPIPLAGDMTLGDSFDFAKAFNDQLLSALEVSPGVTSFGSAQALASVLSTALGLPPGTIAANYDPTSQDLTYNVQLTETLPIKQTDLDFNFGLGDLAQASTSSTVSLDAQVRLNFTIGFNLSPLAAGQTLTDKLSLSNAAATGTVTLTGSNISASGEFGFLNVQSSGGTATATGTLGLSLMDPTTGTVGAPVTLTQLQTALAGNLASVVSLQPVTGSATLSLQNITAAGGFLPAPTGNATLTVTLPSFSLNATPQVSLQGFGNLLDFQQLTFSQVVSAFTGVVKYLNSLSGYSFLSTNLPLIDTSVSDLLDYANQFTTAVDQFAANPAGSVQALAPALRTALGLAPDDPSVSVNLTADQVLEFTATFTPPAYSGSVPLNLNLTSLGVPGLSDDLVGDVDAGGTLAAQASATFTLDLGIDLSNPSSPSPFLYTDTGLTLSAQAGASNINASVSLGPLGMFISNGGATLGPAKFTVGLTGGTDGQIPLSSISLNNATVSLSGSASATLPLFFPNLQTPLGGAGNNNISLTIGDLSNISGTTQITTPNFANAFSNVNLTGQLGILIDGLDLFLSTLQQALNSQVFSNLPLVGNNLQSTAEFISNFRGTVISELQGLPNEALATVQQGLLSVLGPDGLNILLPQSGTGTPTLNDIVVTDTPNQVEFSMILGQTYTLATTPLNMDLPGLGFAVNNAGVQVSLGWQFDLGFGVSRSRGFFFDDSKSNELSVDLNATISGLSTTGTLGYLNLGLQDNPASPTAFTAQFAVNITDPGDTGMLTLGELTTPGLQLSQIVSATITGNAAINLLLTANFGSGDFPSLSTDFVLNWGFNAAPTGVSPATFGNAPSVAFDDVSLNLGTFFSNMAQPILSEIQSVLNPIQPIINFFTTPIPVLTDLSSNGPVTLVGLLQAFTNGQVNLSFLQTAATITNLLNSIPSGGSIVIDFGSFDLGGFDIRSGQLSGASPNVTAPMPGGSLAGQLGGDGAAGASSLSFINQMSSVAGGGLQFPLLQNPGTIFGLFLGQVQTLFTFAMPTLSAGLSYSQSFPIPGLSPLAVRIAGTINVGANFKFGYDTYGLTTYVTSGNVADIFQGFYVDATASNFNISGHLGVAAELNLVVASAGAEGGIDANIALSVNDPAHQGKVRANVLAAEFLQSPLSIFTITGSVTAGLNIYATIGVGVFSYTLGPETIASATLLGFNIVGSPPPDTIQVMTQSPNIVAGTPATITVTAIGLTGRPDPGYTGTIDFTSPDSTIGTLGDYTFVEGDKGSHTFQINVGSTVGAHTLAAADVISGNTATGTVNVVPAAASVLVVSGPASVTAGVPATYTVTAQDAFGNVATGYTGTVQFTSTDPNDQAQLPPDTAFAASNNGVLTFTNLVILVTAGIQTISVTDTMMAAVTGGAQVTVNPTVASQIILSQPFPSPIAAGTEGLFELTAEDQYGNIATGYTGTVQSSSDDIQALLPDNYTFQADDFGRHTFRVTLYTPGVHMLSGADTQAASLSVTQTNIIVTPPPPLSPIASLDNGQWGYTGRGLWTTHTGGFDGTYVTTAPATSTTYAQWRIPVPAGIYDVWVTWVPSAPDADNAPYQVSDGATILGTVQENQKLARFSGSYGGVDWADLGSFVINSGAVYVRLSANADGELVADGVLLVPSVVATPSLARTRAGVTATPIGPMSTSVSSRTAVSSSPAFATVVDTRPSTGVSTPVISRARVAVAPQENPHPPGPLALQVAPRNTPPAQHSTEEYLDELVGLLAADVTRTAKRAH